MRFLEHTLSHPVHAKPQSLVLSNGVSVTLIDTGLLRISPPEPANQRVLISCGIHGNETAPMEIVDHLFQEIQSGKLAVVSDVLFIIGNPPAANRAERFIDENLNRLFSGKHETSTTAEAKRASLIEQVTRTFFSGQPTRRLHYDLHTAIRGSKLDKFAVYPYLHQRKWSLTQLAFLESCGIEGVLFSNQPSGTYSYFTSNEFGAHSFTLELGKVRKFGDNDLSNFSAVFDGLKRLISGNESFQEMPRTIQTFSVVEEVIKRTEAFQLHIDDNAENFTEFCQGTLLASDVGYEYRTHCDGERFVFPISNVPCGQRAMLVVAPTSIPFTHTER